MSFNKDTGLYEGYIYLVTNTVNDKKYVGQTRRNIRARWKQHCQYSNHTNKNSAIDRAIGKYGEDKFTIVQLEFFEADTLNELHGLLNEYEIYYIDLYKTLTIENGYNISAGGSKKNYKEKPVDLYDIDGRFIKTFRSAVEASQYLDTTPTNIIKSCKGESTTVSKHIARYHGQPFGLYKTTNQILDSYNEYNRRHILQYSKDGSFISEYASINDAVDKNGFKKARRVYECCLGNTRSAYGFQWKFKDSDEEIVSYFDTRTLLKRPYNQYSLDDVYIRTVYDSNTLANTTGTDVENATNAVYRCANPKYYTKSAYGFKWFYADDVDQPDKTKIISLCGK